MRRTASGASGTTQFVYDQGGLLLAEHDGGGQVVRNYVYLDGVPLATVDASGGISTVLTDQIGQPQKMTDAAGTVTWDRIAGVFGETVAMASGAETDTLLRFPGQILVCDLCCKCRSWACVRVVRSSGHGPC